MDDNNKTRSELLAELDSLRLQVEEWKRVAWRRKEMVEETEAKFLQLTEDIDEVFWIRVPGIAGEQFQVSRSFERIWGRSREELYADPALIFIESIHPDDRLRVEQWLEKREQPIQYRIIRPDGGVRWINDRRFVLYDEQGEVRKVIGIALDLTSMREKFAKFQLAAKAAALERLVAFVAHEVRNPLQVIRGGMEALDTERGDDKKGEGALQELHYGVTAVEDVISQIIIYALPLQLCISEVTIEDLIEATVIKAKKRLGTVTIHTHLLCRDRTLHVDKGKLIQALGNILVNAAEATPEGGEVWIRTTCTSDRNSISISDSGRGIPLENQVRVTEPFFTTKLERVGLGLSISRKIIESHLGTMAISSGEGQGTIVEVILPSTYGVKGEEESKGDG